MRKVCNCAHAENICAVKSSKSSPAVHMHNFDSISVAEEKIHIKLWHMFLVCALILITCINTNEAHTYLEKSSSCFSHQYDYLTSTLLVIVYCTSLSVFIKSGRN